MSPKELSFLLSRTIKANLPVLIKGAPGIGKTDIVMQAAKAAKADIVVMHPVVSDPTDFKGLPAIVDGDAEFLPFGELENLINAKNLTVAFVDDVGQAPAVVQAALMQLILTRQINGQKISDKVVWIAATNRREDRAGVTGILEPVKSRFATIVELEPNIEDWAAWALDNGVPTEVVAFVRFRPELFRTSTPPTNDIVNRPSPRTITNLGRLYSIGIDGLEALQGAAGSGFAAEFIGFVKIYKSLPSVDGILANPESAKVPNEPAALYAISTAIATKFTRENAGRIIRYLSRLPEEFAVLGIRDGMRICEAASQCREFTQWMTKHQDILMPGT